MGSSRDHMDHRTAAASIGANVLTVRADVARPEGIDTMYSCAVPILVHGG
jgi:hypothetical protein